MRKLGYFLLIAGFLALVFMCVIVSARTHSLWIWHTKNLSDQQITITMASDALRDVTLKSNGLVRQAILPALVMLVGGILIGFKKKENKAQH